MKKHIHRLVMAVLVDITENAYLSYPYGDGITVTRSRRFALASAFLLLY